jgi:ATP phosphoribosyltransferase regulatory subunit
MVKRTDRIALAGAGARGGPAAPPRLDRALLPAGLRDVLPPDAAHEASIVERLVATFASHGYQRVKPPLIEFEESLLGGANNGLATETFRLMDPVSQRMMGLRSDFTMQVARIATARLRKAPRPLRLCYAGDVLRVKGAQLRPERQFTQIGLELIGALGAAADSEAVLLAAEALQGLGIKRLSVDLTSPMLVPTVCEGLGIEAGRGGRSLRGALDRKDAAAVAAAAGKHGKLFARLLGAAGPAKRALATLASLELPEAARAEADRLDEVAARVLAANPDLQLTIDPVENRGFEYHTGISFTLFAAGVRGELGSGGRYRAGIGDADNHGSEGEPATGATLYLESIVRALPAPEDRPRVFLPSGAPARVARQMRGDGWIVVAGLEDAADARAEAKRLGCSHVWLKGDVVAVGTERQTGRR